MTANFYESYDDAGTDAYLSGVTLELDYTLTPPFWYNAATGGSLVGSGSPFNPGISTATPSSTTFYASCVPPGTACTGSRTAATFTVVAQPAASAGADQTICVNGTTAPLGGVATNGSGTWSIQGGGTGNFLNGGPTAANATFQHTGGTGPITLRWTVVGGSPCADDTEDVVVTINPTPSASHSGDPATICEGSPFPTITWTLTGATPYDFDLVIDGPGGPYEVEGHTSNTYNFTPTQGGTYVLTSLSNTLNGTSCNGASLGGNVTVTVQPLPNAGNDVPNYSTTSSSPNTNLFLLLGGSAQPGGSWSGPGGPHSGTFNPTIDPEGDYVYTVNATSPCTGSDQATVNVAVVPMQAMVMDIIMEEDGVTPAWEIRRLGDNALMHSQGPEEAYAGSPLSFDGFELEPGNYHLRFPGGLNAELGSYVLRTEATTNDALYPLGRRFVDSNAPATTASPVQVVDQGGSNGTVQLPISDDRILQQACDKYWWRAGDYLVANENPDVAALWNNGNPAQQANTGYDFWFYDPNGTGPLSYSYVRSRRHNQADGYGNVGSARTCHMRVNSTLHGWATANHIPDGLALNVRVRAVVDGVPREWGPACRFKRDEAMALCPPTTLWRVPLTDPKYSCDNATRRWRTHNDDRIYAHPVSGATQYRYRFTNVNEGYDQTRTVNTYYLNMGWHVNAAPPLTPGQTYDVTVQAYKGGIWCAVGDPCKLLICTAAGDCSGSGMIGGEQNSALDNSTTGAPLLGLWPNPNRGDLLNLSITGLDMEANTIAMDILDLSGKRVGGHTIPVQDGTVSTVVALNGELAAGMYTVQFLAGDQVFTERLVIQP